MTRIYIVRHSETIGNIMHYFQGTSDFEISDLGIKQLAALKKRFSKIQIDAVYSSPLKRTLKTAEVIIGDKPLKIQSDSGLIEVNGGILEGKSIIESFKANDKLFEIWTNHPEDFIVEDGEATVSAYQRIWETVLNIAKSNNGKIVACATHGFVIRCLICKVLHNDIKLLRNIPWSENTSVSIIDFDDNFTPKLTLFNDYSHLSPEDLNYQSSLNTLD